MEFVKSLKQSKLIKYLFMSLIGSILLAISSKIKIPFYPVPMTMQTFMVLFLGIILGYKIALLSVCLYLLEGIIGFPVFSNSPERGVGWVYFTGPTMGYLLGFISACYLASFIKVKDNYLIIFFKLIFSVSTIYILGVLWLGIAIGWDKPLFKLGVAPFLLAEFFKITILTLLTKKILNIKRFI